MKKFDVIIVGSGTGGSIAAETIAKAGLNVALIDQKEKEKIGLKVCGDAIGKHHFEELGLAEPQGEELEGLIKGCELFSPDKQTKFVIAGGFSGFIINRLKFGQRLVNQAIDSGATLFDQTKVIELLKGDAWGVKIKKKDGSSSTILGSIIIDASGYAAVLRKQIDALSSDPVLPEEVEVCYREIHELKDTKLENTDYIKIYLTNSMAPGGYVWIFPEGTEKVNLGLGVQMIPNHKNPKKLFEEHVRPLFSNTKIIHAGGGMVPTRRPIWSLVDDGIVLVGDSGCQVNPIHGGGIGPSMQAGRLAGQTIIKALQKELTSKEALWSYNVNYMQAYGAKQAQLDLFRILLQRLDDVDLNYGLAHEIIKEEDVLRASLGEGLHLNITEKVKRVFKSIRRLKLLNRLRKVAKQMNVIKGLYQAYPLIPDELGPWKKNVLKCYEEVNGMFE
ncbi:MAG: geranylgeranyl reductase family protein [Candidatus Helarchaeota archaeon]